MDIQPRVPKTNKNFRISDTAVTTVESLAKMYGCTNSTVIEALINEYGAPQLIKAKK
jgi:hypothetical protein